MSITTIIGTLQLVASLAGQPDTTTVQQAEAKVYEFQRIEMMTRPLQLSDRFFLSNPFIYPRENGLRLTYNHMLENYIHLSGRLTFTEGTGEKKFLEKPEGLQFLEGTIGIGIKLTNHLNLEISEGLIKTYEYNKKLMNLPQTTSPIIKIGLIYKF